MDKRRLVSKWSIILLVIFVLVAITLPLGLTTTRASSATQAWIFSSAGCFPKHLSDSYIGDVLLTDLLDVPSEVQGIYKWDGKDWLFWAPGVPGCTLTTVGGGHTYDYMVCVTGPCQWEMLLSTPGSAEKNFKLLISDEVNAIADFEHLYLNISTIGMHYKGNASNKWLEFAPLVNPVDLRPLVGEKAQAIWNGNVPSGNYTKVFIHVNNVWGNLSSALGNKTVQVKLPGNKLHISKPFMVTDDEVTSFVYDIAVVAAGNNSKKDPKYILKPQIAQSGANQSYEEVLPE
jgi:hypothetical protein